MLHIELCEGPADCNNRLLTAHDLATATNYTPQTTEYRLQTVAGARCVHLQPHAMRTSVMALGAWPAAQKQQDKQKTMRLGEQRVR
jgi:hypothetical protein